MPTIEQVRSRFPAIAAAPDALLDNAGGSQLPDTVIDAMTDYMRSTFVQLGADYETSRRCTRTVADAHTWIETFVNAGDAGRVILGPSTTALCIMLANCTADAAPGSPSRNEIVIAQTAHEANAGPWARIATHRGFTLRTWPINPDTLSLHLEDLAPLLSERTRIVAFPTVSNVLGRIEDAAAITRMAHDAGARVVVDDVAYAPHRALDAQALGADWRVYSTYKVFGPHMAALFGTHDAMAELDGPNHAFIPKKKGPYTFEPGGVSHEGAAGLLGLKRYIRFLATGSDDGEPTRDDVLRAFDWMEQQETALQQRLIDGLASLPGVRIIGPSTTDAQARVSTVSFVHSTMRSAEIARAANEARLGVRYGNFYAHRLCTRLAELGVLHAVDDGVVRISLAHYNTADEVDRALACLQRIIG